MGERQVTLQPATAATSGRKGKRIYLVRHAQGHHNVAGEVGSPRRAPGRRGGSAAPDVWEAALLTLPRRRPFPAVPSPTPSCTGAGTMRTPA